MKILLVIGTLLISIFFLGGCGNVENSNDSVEQNNVTSVNNSTSQNQATNVANTATATNIANTINDSLNIITDLVQDEVSSFTTPLTSGSPNRITNIKLTCAKINEYKLKNGETFSFNQMVGPCTAEEGYLEAEIYVDNKIDYALGGGNCQVSTTLYNACLQVPGITIIERHEHGMPVDYIEDGKDATVSYNTLDFSFRNDTGKDLTLYAYCDDVNVGAKIFR